MTQDDYKAQAARALRNTTECGDCLIWNGSTAGGRNKTPKWGNKSLRRIVWQASNPPLKKLEFITTSCGNPKCLAHLAKTTRSKITKAVHNTPRVKAIKKVKNTAHSRAHLAKINMEIAREIRESDKPSSYYQEVHGISPSTVSSVRLGKRWAETQINPFTGLGAR